MTRTYTVTAIVLRRRDLGESDRAMAIYTPDRGQLPVVAKGSRRPGARLAGASEPFTISRMQLAAGRSMDVVTQCEVLNSFPALRMGLATVTRAGYLCDLVGSLTAERDAGASRAVYALLEQALLQLQDDPAWSDGILFAFELQLLSAIGYQPALDGCVVCRNPVRLGCGGFSAELGGILCGQHADDAPDSFRLGEGAHRWLLHAGIAHSGRSVPAGGVRKEVAALCRAFVMAHCERKVRSLEFLDSVRAMERAGAEGV
ncbi:MAG: DNA repair protein RecO [Armatimonadetes bacterium]|nr:DNA repair protein RecO [Armatimonadota bacterium]MDE2206441.1 DNA repair protein RecO [Armatimonadota bacterium]